MHLALKYKAQTSRQSPHLIWLFLWLIKYWYILNKITFRNLPEKKSMLLKKLNNIAWSRFLHAQEAMKLYGAMNYGSAPRITARLQ